MAHFFLIYLLDAFGIFSAGIGAGSVVTCDVVSLPRYSTGSFSVKTSPNWSHALLLSDEIDIGNNVQVNNYYYLIQPLLIESSANTTYMMYTVNISYVNYVITTLRMPIPYLTIRVLNQNLTIENGGGFFASGEIFCISW